MKVEDVAAELDRLAPTRYAEPWDNVGLLIGTGDEDVERLLLCIDLTEGVVAEARSLGVQMVMAYHPVIFKPIARLGGGPALSAARAGLSVYAMHTALDAAPGGTSDVLADAMGLGPRKPITPARAEGQCKIVTFVPPEARKTVADAAFAAGAGRLGEYSQCGFACEGTGTFFGEAGANPVVGQAGRLETATELRWETIAPAGVAAQVVGAVRRAHPYEEPPVEVYRLEDVPPGVGLGRIGPMGQPSTLDGLVRRLVGACGLSGAWVARAARHQQSSAGQDSAHIHRGACCPGSAGSLALAAGRQGAEVYVTGEMRHHDALAAVAAGVSCICLGHSHSERITLPTLADHLAGALPELAVHVSRADADPLEIV